jgi:hypothetical protein
VILSPQIGAFPDPGAFAPKPLIAALAAVRSAERAPEVRPGAAPFMGAPFPARAPTVTH